MEKEGVWMALPIAIVEDQTPDAQRLEELLQQQLPEAECTWFACGDDFLRAAAEPGLYAVVFLDICMAGTNGIETARRLRQADPEVLIVFVTSSPEYVWDAFPVHPFDYLLKPFRDQDLMSAIARVREKEGAAQPAEDTLLLPKGDKSKYVLQTLNYIAEHYADTDINIASIARHIGISEGHLSHVFKKETNYTALGYLTQYRIHTARKLLRDCRYKVYEVAEMVGYRDVAYFGSTFKKLTGMSPSEYQDRCR